MKGITHLLGIFEHLVLISTEVGDCCGVTRFGAESSEKEPI